jgi:peroxiredoxin
MPALEQVWRQQHGKGLEVLAISADRPRSKADVDQVMHFFTFPAAMYGNLSKNEFGTPTTLPITYVIDKSGQVANIMTPDIAPLNQAGFGDTIKALLDAKNDAKPEEKKSEDKKDDTKKDDAKSETKTDAKP